jgi:hypothetical protein
MAGNKFPKVGAEQVLIHDQYDRAIKDVIAQADKADKAINDIGGPVDVKINIDDSELSPAISDVIALSADQNPKILVDRSELDPAIRDVNKLGDDQDTRVTVRDEQLEQALGLLNDIKTLSVIDIVLNVAGAGLGLVDAFTSLPGVGGLLEMDAALAMIQARTGQIIPDAEYLIADLYTNGWGESREQIAGVLAQAVQLGVAQDDLGAASQAAFETATVTGWDVHETLAAMDTMVRSGLVPDFQTAADVMVTGFQTGNDKAGDLKDTLTEYATKFASLGLTGGQALALINSGLEAGIFNSDKIGDAVNEFAIRLGDIGTDENVQKAFTDLDALSDIDLAGLLEGYEAGTTLGGEVLQGVINALGDAAEADPLAAQQLGEAIFGTPFEDISLEAFTKLSTDAEAAFGDIEGRATQAGSAASNNLLTSLNTFFRWIEQQAIDFLSSDQIDLDQKITDIKTGLTEAMAILSEGGTLGEAIEIGLNLPGFNDSVLQFQSSIGNFAISVLELIAGVQEFTGNTEGAASTRQEISRLGAQQLAFDLQIANPDDIANVVATAMDRGVEQSTIQDAVGTAIDEMLAAGDIAGAQTLLDSLNDLPAAIITVYDVLGNQLEQIELPRFEGEGMNEYMARLEQYKETLESIPGNTIDIELPGVDTSDIEQQVDDAAAAAELAWIDAINNRDFSLAQTIAEGLDDEALLADTFRSAIQGGDFGVAEAIAEDLSGNTAFLEQAFTQAFEGGAAGLALEIANMLGDPELIAQAQALANAYTEEFNAALAEGDVETAFRLAEQLDDDDLRAKVDELKTTVEEAGGAVSTASDDMAASVEEADERIATAATDNTITASFQAISDAAAMHFPIVIDWAGQTSGAISELDRRVRGLLAGAGAFASFAAQVDNFPLGQLQAITNAAMGFAGAQTTVNNGGDDNRTVNIVNNPQNGAQVAADTYTIGAVLGGP